MKKSVEEIVNWIASLYTINTRSVDEEEKCLYNGPEGRHCAMAMMCKHPEQLKECGPYQEGLSAIGIANKHPEWIKEEFQGYTASFYSDIQFLHDNRGFWTEEGLSDSGKAQAAYIIKTYSQQTI